MAEEKKPFHERVAEKIIDQLKAGTAPWQRPWVATDVARMSGSILPVNPVTGKRYRGVNVVQLMAEGHADNRWMTYKQAAAVGAQVRRGEKGALVQYWKFDEERAVVDQAGKPVLDQDGNPIKDRVPLERPRAFYAVVFNAEQIDGLPERSIPKPPVWDPIERAEALLKASGADIFERPSNAAFYNPNLDAIVLPERQQFDSAAHFYATALHELGHWTGHSTRLDRDLSHPYGSEGYAREELRAEIASMIIGDEIGIGHDPREHAAYVGSWIRVLENDPMEIVRACSDAEKINTYMREFEQKQVQGQAAAIGDPRPRAILIPESASMADRLALLAQPVAIVLADTDREIGRYQAFNHRYDPTMGAPHPTLEQALSAAGMIEIGDVVGRDATDYQTMFQTAIERLSPVFGIAPGSETHNNAYLERQGLAQAFAVFGEKLTRTPTFTVQAWDEEERQYVNVNSGLPADAALNLFSQLSREYRTPHENPNAVAGFDFAGDSRIVSDNFELVIAGISNPPDHRRGERTIPAETLDWADAHFVKLAQVEAGLESRADHWRHLVENDERLHRAGATATATASLAQFADARTPLSVPFREKNEARQLGAQWDKGAKTWYIPAGVDQAPFAKWLPDAGSVDAASTKLASSMGASIERHVNEQRGLAADDQDREAMSGHTRKVGDASARYYLAVPYGERELAKSVGARWDPRQKSWYAPEGASLTAFGRWDPKHVKNRQAEPATPENEFADAMRSMGLTVPNGHPHMDGKRHRVPVEGDKGKETSGSYRAFLDGHPAGHIENFKTNLDMKWKYSGCALSDEERARLNAEAAEKRQQREIEQKAIYEATAKRVQVRAKTYRQISEPTPYMLAKGIAPTSGAMTDGKDSVIHLPAIDAKGTHWTTQYIQDDGTKRFAKDSQKEGCFHIVGGQLADLDKVPRIIIGEGYATMASTTEVVGHPTVAGFDAGNLPVVAASLRERYPDKPFLILADDDLRVQQKHGRNPGRLKAAEAADIAGGIAVYPIFAPGEQEADPKRFTDFNDVAQNSVLGRAGLERQIAAAIEAAEKRHAETRTVKQQKNQQHQISGPPLEADEPKQWRSVRR